MQRTPIFLLVAFYMASMTACRHGTPTASDSGTKEDVVMNRSSEFARYWETGEAGTFEGVDSVDSDDFDESEDVVPVKIHYRRAVRVRQHLDGLLYV